MLKRKLGRTDLELTPVGLGTWAIGGGAWKFGWGSQNNADAISGILRGIELGINWIDTARVYGDGQSEKLVGEALRKLGRHRPLIATKCSRKVLSDGSVTGQLDAKSVKAECEESLRRLGIDTIDLYQMHWPEPDEQIEEGWGAMAELFEEGKVRHIGVSNFDVSQMERLNAIHPIASLQPPYNMLDRRAENDLFDYCVAHDIGIVCYSPMARGLLSGAMTTERALHLESTDHRRREPMFQSPQIEEHLSLVQSLRAIAERNNRSVAELAIAWVLRRDEVTSAIVGTRSGKQIEGTVAAGNWELTRDDIDEIERLLAEHAEKMARICGSSIS